MPRLWRDIGSSDCKGARANGLHDTRLRPQCVRTGSSGFVRNFFEIYRFGAFRRSCFAISNESVSQSVAYFEVPPALTPPPTRSPAPPPVSHVAFRPTVSNKGQSDGAPPCSPVPTLPGPRQAVNASTAEYSYSQGGQEGGEIGPVLPKTNRENLIGRNAAFIITNC